MNKLKVSDEPLALVWGEGLSARDVICGELESYHFRKVSSCAKLIVEVVRELVGCSLGLRLF